MLLAKSMFDVAFGAGKEWVLPLEIVDGHYKSETLKVDEKKVNPPKKELKRILREQAELKEIYSHLTHEKYWDGPFVLPVDSVVTSPFGSKRIYNGEMKSFHQGLDLRAHIGTPIHAASGGVVVLAKDLFFTGNTVLIDHGYGVFTVYCHMSALKVKNGDRSGKRRAGGACRNDGTSEWPAFALGGGHSPFESESS